MHGRRVVDVRADALCPLDEERDGVPLVHRREVELPLAGDPHRLAARGDDAQRGSGREQLGEPARRVGQQLLEVVEDEMRLLVAEPGRDRGRDSSPVAPMRSAIVGTTSAGSSSGASGTKMVPPSASSERRRASSSREAGLAGAARPDDREQTRLALEPERGRLEQLLLAAEKVRRGRAAGRRLPASAAAGSSAVAELEEPDRRVEVLEPVPAEVDGRGVRETSAAVASERITWPPCARAATRAPRWTSIPTYPSAVAVGAPVWRPIRTRIGPPASASLATRAAATAPAAVGKATKNASPCVSTSTPPWSANAARRTRRCSASASA